MSLVLNSLKTYLDIFIRFSAFVVVAIVASSCAVPSTGLSTTNVAWPAPTKFSTDSNIIDQLNEHAAKDSRWFKPLIDSRNQAEARFSNNLTKRIGVYLENDIYLYSDHELESYLLGIVDKLTKPFLGNQIDIGIVVETNTRFSAYVDELNQIHVTTGLLRGLENEDQLAGVLAHELGHILLRHGLDVNASSSATRALERMGSLYSTAKSTTRKSKSKEKRKVEDGFDVLGLVWTDLVIPKWSRDKERQADQLALDLMKASGYNQEELITAIAKIHDATVKRSVRVSRLNGLLSQLVENNKNRVELTSDKKLNKEIVNLAETTIRSMLDGGFILIDKASETHDDREKRIKNLKVYLNRVYDDFDLPPTPKIQEFNRLVKTRDGGALQADLAAIETLIAIGARNVRAAKAHMKNVRVSDNSNPQISISLASMSMDVANRKYDKALAQLEKMAQNEQAPAEVYIKLSRLQAWFKDYDAAESTLRLGTQRIGRNYRFLPPLIRLKKVQGNTEAAEQFTLDCAKYDGGQSIQLVGSFLGYDFTPADSYYNNCAEVLGYDVRAKRREATIQSLKSVTSQGKSLLDNILAKP